MTEKRFRIVNMGLDGQFIKDTGKIMMVEDVVALLNKQHKENENLKKQNETLKKLNARLQNKIAFNDQHFGERARKEFEGIEEWASGGH